MKKLIAIFVATATCMNVQAKDIVDALKDCGQFKTLVAAVKAAGLVETLKGDGPFTVFAPNDHAFARLPKGTVENLLKPENKERLKSILTFHVVGDAKTSCSLRSGEIATVNGAHLRVKRWGNHLFLNSNYARVREADVRFSNGIVHVIDKVMLPPRKKTEFTSTAKEPKEMDIVDTAVAAGKFKTLAAALKSAGLIETLKSKGPFTVFAPTDEAFAKLPKGTVENLLKPENRDKLVSILKYHVISGKVASTDITEGKAKTVSGKSVRLKLKNDVVMVNKAQVTKADVSANNGIIHIIDTVLIPKGRNKQAKSR